MKNRICVNIETLFTGLPYTERIRKVHELGFSAIEFWTTNNYYDGTQFIPELKDMDGIARVTTELNLEVGTFNVNSRDGSNGGALITRTDQKTLENRMQEVIPIAHQLKSKNLTILTGHTVKGLSHIQQKKNIMKGLERVLRIAEGHNVNLILEPLNTAVDHPGYFLESIDEAAEITRSVNHENLKLLFDVYHIQIMSGNIMSRIEKYLPFIGHFHFAGVPGRHEIYQGELDYDRLTKFIRSLNYSGLIGLEYFPAVDHAESLASTRRYLLEWIPPPCSSRLSETEHLSLSRAQRQKSQYAPVRSWNKKTDQVNGRNSFMAG
jgi:hydroxypyruvate isomerase